MFHRRKCPKCKISAFASKQIEIIMDQKKESNRKKRNVFSVQQENLSASIFLLPCFFLQIHSYLYYLCFFPPTYKLMCLLPLFCYPYSLIFTVFNSIIPTLNCEIFPELMDSQELEDNRPCNLNSSLKKL